MTHSLVQALCFTPVRNGELPVSDRTLTVAKYVVKVSANSVPHFAGHRSQERMLTSAQARAKVSHQEFYALPNSTA